MKAIASLTLGATAFVGAYATGALAEDAKDAEFRASSRSAVVSDMTSGKDELQRSFVQIENASPKDSSDAAPVPTPPAAPAAPQSSTVRMVIESTSDNGDGDNALCVFVPAGDNDSAGAISCPGGNVRMFEFGPDHGREYVVGGEAMSEEEIRDMVEARMDELRERLEAQAEWQVDVIDRFNSDRFEQEMERIEEEMDNLSDRFSDEYDDFEGLTPEDRARYNRDMERFSQQMAEFGQQMARLQQEAMAEVAAELARRREAGRPVIATAPPAPPAPSFSWSGSSSSPHFDRQVIHTSHNGTENVTIIERQEDENGNPRVVIHTTDPGSVEVVHINADEVDDVLESGDDD